MKSRKLPLFFDYLIACLIACLPVGAQDPPTPAQLIQASNNLALQTNSHCHCSSREEG